MRLILMAGLALVLFASPAFAQIVPPIDQPWYQELVVWVFAGIGTALSGLFLWVSTMLKTKWGIDVDEKYRKMLQETLMNAMRAYLSSIGWLPGQAVPEAAALNFVANYAGTYSPTTLKHFGIAPGGETLKVLATAYLPTVNPQTAPTPDAMKPTPTGTIKTDAAVPGKPTK